MREDMNPSSTLCATLFALPTPVTYRLWLCGQTTTGMNGSQSWEYQDEKVMPRVEFNHPMAFLGKTNILMLQMTMPFLIGIDTVA